MYESAQTKLKECSNCEKAKSIDTIKEISGTDRGIRCFAIYSLTDLCEQTIYSMSMPSPLINVPVLLYKKHLHFTHYWNRLYNDVLLSKNLILISTASTFYT